MAPTNFFIKEKKNSLFNREIGGNSGKWKDGVGKIIPHQKKFWKREKKVVFSIERLAVS